MSTNVFMFKMCSEQGSYTRVVAVQHLVITSCLARSISELLQVFIASFYVKYSNLDDIRILEMCMAE